MLIMVCFPFLGYSSHVFNAYASAIPTAMAALITLGSKMSGDFGRSSISKTLSRFEFCDSVGKSCGAFPLPVDSL